MFLVNRNTLNFWVGDIGRALRYDQTAQLVAIYLMTSPFSDKTGVYYCPISSITHDIFDCHPIPGYLSEYTPEITSVPLVNPYIAVYQALERLEKLGFCLYDFHSSFVFVKDMALWQLAQRLSPKDYRIKKIKRYLELVPRPFKFLFLKFYNDIYNLGFSKAEIEEGLENSLAAENKVKGSTPAQ